MQAPNVTVVGEEDDDFDEEELGFDPEEVLPIVPIGHEVLSQPSNTVTEEIFASGELEELVRRMLLTMHLEEGVGLAAPQCAIPIRVVVMEYKPEEVAKYVLYIVLI